LPAFAARLALGEMANELLLSSARIEPAQLLATNYKFKHSNLENALRDLLGKH
jgi:NAD dependent epimerase/dehydratase family enzyme